MTIDKPLYYNDFFYGKPRRKLVSPKVAKVITKRLELSEGGSTNQKPKPQKPSNIEFYREQLFKIYGGGVMKLKKSELKELLQFHIDNGGI